VLIYLYYTTNPQADLCNKAVFTPKIFEAKKKEINAKLK